MAGEIEYIIEPSKKRIIDFREIWQYRELFFFFASRDIKIKYKQTFLGVAWVLLQPILTVVIFSLFFGRALNVPSAGVPYPVFVFSGLLLWNTFAASINNAGSSMVTNAPIIKKIYFPRLIIPVASIMVAFVDFVIAFVLFVLVLLYYQIPVDILALVVNWPLAILVMLIGAVGISCWLAALTVKYRDFRYVIPFVLQVALFLSPVIYPVSIIENEILNHIFALNPMYAAINLFRRPFTDLDINPMLIGISMISSGLFLIAGFLYFKRTEAYFADIA